MTSEPKILIVGAWRWPWYQEACAMGLKTLGCQVERFSWFDEFHRWVGTRTEPMYKSKWLALQNRLLLGPALWRINRRLLQTAEQTRPNIIWFYNCTHIFPKTVRRLRHMLPHSLLVQYANDNPFGAHVKPDYWRHLKRAIPDFDIHFVYRKSNQVDFRKLGARVVHLLRSYYIPTADYRVQLQRGDERYRADVVFAGHFEPDGRLQALEAVAGAGYHVNLFGGGWINAEKQLLPNSSLRTQFPIAPVLGENYRKAISGAKIALCFLSKINADTYTRRNFQIPAMQTFMLSEYTDDLATLFVEGVEIEFFRSREELLDKVTYYLQHESQRKKIAQKGYERVVRDGHDVRSRMQTFLKIVQSEKGSLNTN